jgi:hypothetical protein
MRPWPISPLAPVTKIVFIALWVLYARERGESNYEA